MYIYITPEILFRHYGTNIATLAETLARRYIKLHVMQLDIFRL